MFEMVCITEIKMLRIEPAKLMLLLIIYNNIVTLCYYSQFLFSHYFWYSSQVKPDFPKCFQSNIWGEGFYYRLNVFVVDFPRVKNLALKFCMFELSGS